MNRSTYIIYRCLYLIMLVSSLLILVNHAAPNPTGRWFSSEFVDTTQSGSVFGQEAERLLARDLSMRQNDSNNGQRRCFCSQNAETPPDRCNVCEVHTSDISNYRIPDFVNSQLIIDSKAVQVLRIDDQISDFISVAHQSNRPLWLFVRLDTTYTQGTLEQIQATGGGIVKYFVVDGHGYLLAVEQSLNNILIAVLIFAGGVMVWQFIVFRRTNSPSDDDYYQYDDVDNAEDSIEETEEFMRRMERLSKKTIKDEDDPKKK